jgi:hypothetical protein
MERLREAAYTLNRRNKGSGKLSVTFAVVFTNISVSREYVNTLELDSVPCRRPEILRPNS